VRLVVWNIRGGSRTGLVVDAVVALAPDVAVLVDCKAKHLGPIVAKAAAAGHKYHLKSPAGYTGIVMLSKHPLAYGQIDESPIPQRWLHGVSDHWGLEISATYAPLPKAIGDEPPVTEFWNWLVPACDLIVDRKAVLCGDFNTGVSKVDGPDDYMFRGASPFADLAAHGWRDAYRELHPRGEHRSWWNKQRGFRIDHCMLSRGMPAPNSIVYDQEIAGIRAAGSPSDAPSSPAVSDHAALLLNF
jgi:exonuclease III